VTIAAVATEAKAAALITECRRCLAVGDRLEAKFIKQVIDQLLNATVTNTAARTDILPNHKSDGRDAIEAAAVDAN
jgi:hypothetical protein